LKERETGMLVKKTNTNSSPDKTNQISKEEQLSWLMDEYGDMVVRLAYTYVKQKQLAEDISQEVFLSCYKNLEAFQNKSTYKTWIYRITVNKCKDYFKTWSYKNLIYQDFVRTVFASGEKSFVTNIVDKEENEQIFEKVLSLPVKFREVIILHYYEEQSINDISNLLNLNPNTVKTRLHRARKLLYSFFKEGHYDGE
jgi:RNA polymerase sigma factor (sigma-70 family)